MPDLSLKSAPDWFRNAVIYQIYPQSFYDTNADGIGDIPGIIAKLDHIESLNVNAIWLNPCFDSPFQDAGYDIRDFYKVAERYGTNDDLKRLIDEARRRGIHVILDLVAGHTSIEHEWFQKSASRERSEYDQYYCWTDGWADSPGKYRFISGFGERDGYYMINFFYSQPALNYGFVDPDPACGWQLPVTSPAARKVREELRNVMKFYLDLGCAGFRVDMANCLARGENEALRQKGLQEIWQDYKGWMRANYPNAVLIAEWGNPAQAVPAGFDADFMLSFAPGESGYPTLFRKERYLNSSSNLSSTSPRSFFARESSGNSRTFVDELVRNLAAVAGKGYVSIVTGNHDQARIRRGRSLADLKVAYMGIFTLPGLPVLYYGDEIGMQYIGTVGNVEGSYERGGSRTPMQWQPGEHAGFSQADPAQFYTMIDPSVDRPNVAAQEADERSLLNFTRNLIGLRRRHAALSCDGQFHALISEFQDAPFIYKRTGKGERFVVALNPDAKPRTVELAVPGTAEMVLSCGEIMLDIRKGCGKLAMGGVSGVIFRIAEEY